MDDKRISIIICDVGDHENYERLLNSVMSLTIPSGYTADVLETTCENGLCAAYNEAMNASDAKYKVYIKGTTEIKSNTILEQIVKVFEQDGDIGIIGTFGVKRMPLNGVWITAEDFVGIFEERDSSSVKQYEVNGMYEDVVAVSGAIIATSFDIPWREDLFRHIEFEDVAQCVEMQRSGKKVVVIKTDEPVVRAKGALSIDEEDRKKFLIEYSKSLFPLVSVVIATYNRPDYLKQAIASACNQSYQNIEIIVSDNGKNSMTKEVVISFEKVDARVKYYRCEEKGEAANWISAYSHISSQSEYVNFLCDDDLLMPEKIERMVGYYLKYPDVGLVTSRRKVIDGNGNVVSEYMGEAITQLTRFDSKSLGKNILLKEVNNIGEPSTPLVRRRNLRDAGLGWWRNVDSGYCMSDFPTWLRSMERGDVIYIPEALSAFRVHSEQSQMSVKTQCRGTLAWLPEITYAYSCKKYIETREEYYVSLVRWMQAAGEALCNAFVHDIVDDDLTVLKKKYLEIAESLANNRIDDIDIKDIAET